MSNSPEERDAARQRAQTYFTQSEKRDALVREEIEKERAASAAKTAKLRALRLAKEATEREQAAELARNAPPETSVKRKRRTAKSPA